MRRILHTVFAARILLYSAVLLLAFTIGRVSVPRVQFVPRKITTREVIRERIPVSPGGHVGAVGRSLAPQTSGSGLQRPRERPVKHACSIGGTATETFQECIEKQAKG